MSTLLHHQADLLASRPAFSTAKFSKDTSLHAVSSASGHVAASDGHQVLLVPGGGSSLSHSQGLAFAPPTSPGQEASIHSLHWSLDELLCITAGSQMHVYHPFPGHPGAAAGPPLLLGGLRCPYPIKATAWHPSAPDLLAMATEHAVMVASIEPSRGQQPAPSHEHPQQAHSPGVTVTGACRLLGVQHRPSSLPAALSSMCITWLHLPVHHDTTTTLDTLDTLAVSAATTTTVNDMAPQTAAAATGATSSASVHALAVSWGSHLQVLTWAAAAALPQGASTDTSSHLSHSAPWHCVSRHHVTAAPYQGSAALLSNAPSALAGLPGGGLVVCWDHPLTIKESDLVRPLPSLHTPPGAINHDMATQPQVPHSRAPISLAARSASTSPRSHTKPTISHPESNTAPTTVDQRPSSRGSNKAVGEGQQQPGSKQRTAMDDNTLAMLASLGVGVGLAGPDSSQQPDTVKAVSSQVEVMDAPVAVSPAAVTSAGLLVGQGVQQAVVTSCPPGRVMIQEVLPASQGVHSAAAERSPGAEPVAVASLGSGSGGDAAKPEAVQVSSRPLPSIGDLLSGQFGSKLMIDDDDVQPDLVEVKQPASTPHLLTTTHASHDGAAHAAARGLLLGPGPTDAGGDALPACGVLAVLHVRLDAGHTSHAHHVSSTWGSTAPLYLPHPTLLSVLPYPAPAAGQTQQSPSSTTQGGSAAASAVAGGVAAGVPEGWNVVIGVASATAPPLVQLFTLCASAAQCSAQPAGVLHLPAPATPGPPHSGLTAQGVEGNRIRGLTLGWKDAAQGVQGVQGTAGQVKQLCVHVMQGRTSPVAASSAHAGAAPPGSFTLLKKKGHVSTTLHDVRVAQYSVPPTCLPGCHVDTAGGAPRAAAGVAASRCDDTADGGAVEGSSKAVHELMQVLDRKLDLCQQQAQAGFGRIAQQMIALELYIDKRLHEMEARLMQAITAQAGASSSPSS